ncbi:hypothetical protein GC56T2_3099 [Geobacillus sp. C56-T2]|nr:hypothetical protein GC56T2_3099 [Geobacillus sp. C56-T2]
MPVGDRRRMWLSIVRTDAFGAKESVNGFLCGASRSVNAHKSLEAFAPKRSGGGG